MRMSERYVRSRCCECDKSCSRVSHFDVVARVVHGTCCAYFGTCCAYGSSAVVVVVVGHSIRSLHSVIGMLMAALPSFDAQWQMVCVCR